MTTLFSADERTRMRIRRWNESSYSFLSTSAWPSMERVRQFWEGWFAQYPDENKVALAARFRSSDDHPHLSAFLELFSFTVLKRSGFEIESDPPVGDLALEFLADRDADNLSLYVECTVTGKHKVQAGKEALEADLLEAINKTPTGRFMLGFEVKKHGATALAGKPLRGALGKWLSSLDADQVIAMPKAGEQLPEWTWETKGWRVTFEAIPTADSEDDEDGAIGMTLSASDHDEHKRLRRAMDGKASKYGNLGRPLLVVLNSTELQSDDDFLKAVLGDTQWNINLSSKAVHTSRKPNGVFHDAKGPRNVNMSAAMHGHFKVHSFASSECPLTLTHHPYAVERLPLGLFPFCEERYFNDDGKGETVQPTTTVREFFGLEDGWPHFDLDPK